MSGAIEIDAATLAALLAAGVSEAEARCFAYREAEWCLEAFGTAPGAAARVTLIAAVAALANAGAPASLTRAYAATRCRPSKIMQDLIHHTRGGKLPAASAQLLERRMVADSAQLRPSPSQVWADVRASRRQAMQ